MKGIQLFILLALIFSIWSCQQGNECQDIATFVDHTKFTVSKHSDTLYIKEEYIDSRGPFQQEFESKYILADGEYFDMLGDLFLTTKRDTTIIECDGNEITIRIYGKNYLGESGYYSEFSYLDIKELNSEESEMESVICYRGEKLKGHLWLVKTYIYDKGSNISRIIRYNHSEYYDLNMPIFKIVDIKTSDSTGIEKIIEL